MNIIAPVTLAAASLVLGARSTSEGFCLLFFIHRGRVDSAVLQAEKRFRGKAMEECDGAGEVPGRAWGRLDGAARGAEGVPAAGVPWHSCTAACRGEAPALRPIAQRGPRGPAALGSITPILASPPGDSVGFARCSCKGSFPKAGINTSGKVWTLC